MNYFDTIAAVSTPRGKGGVAVIRISGNDAIEIGDRIFSKRLSETVSNHAVYGKIYLPLADGSRRVIDDGIATVFRAPASFTGEDTVEISCHGGVLVTESVLSACFAAGARQATAGEFTRRAFVNGKTRLDSAEALSALLEAKTLSQLTLARSGMGGHLAKKSDELYERLMKVASELRADIDFPDEDVSEMTDEDLRALLLGVLEDIKRLAGTYSTGRAVADGVKTAICGRTNSGKSSLYNRIIGHDAAIVTDIEGTTRDILSDTAALGDVTLRISDTAGLRESDDPVERIGISRALDAIYDAELVLFVIDGSRTPDESDLELAERVKNASGYKIAIVNKNDLPEREEALDLAYGFDTTVRLSAKTGDGMEKLKAAVSKAFVDGSLDIASDAIVSTARQYGALVKASELLGAAIEAFDFGYPSDLVSSDVERAMTELAALGGRDASDEIVDRIFSSFCVGK